MLKGQHDQRRGSLGKERKLNRVVSQGNSKRRLPRKMARGHNRKKLKK